ncbi:MAG TPA: aldolase/citrate lyase family protein [Stellaceae bacterium]|nr:aldolase/citrate lyase family protein [Stellaceae bacterium]
MAELPRLNGIIRALEQGQPAITTFTQAEIEATLALAASRYDGIVFEMEHNAWDVRALRDALQYLLNRRQIALSGSLAPAVTPLVRIPPNGNEKNQWLAKQALDLGAYGIVWPHVSTAEEAYNAVAACRYPRLPTAPLYQPAGLRGDGPTAAARYWGLTQPEYYAKADVWPLNPAGEILVMLMIEDTAGIANLREMLRNVPGIGVILIGEGDLSQELGHPRQYDHPVVREAMGEIVRICREHDVPVGHPHVDASNAERILGEGYRFLMAAPTRSYAGLDKARALAGRG